MDNHNHDHDHAHHVHAPSHFGWAFGIGIALNTGFVIVEAGYGIVGHSMALISDAGHNLSDVLGLAMAWTASLLMRRAPSPRFTYGLSSSTILAALFNAVLLLVATGAIAVEAVQRFFAPQPVAGKTMIVVAAIGIAINGVTALMFMRGRKSDLNIRGAFLHMVSDVAVSAGVVVAGFAILATGLVWIDPVVSLVIALIIVAGTWSLLRDSMSMTLQGVPSNIDHEAVRSYLETHPGVAAIHDLHIWPMSTTETALTCHLVMPGGHPGDDALCVLSDHLREKFLIAHATLQVEISDQSDCGLQQHAV